MSFTDKLYMMIDELPPLPSLKLPEPIINGKIKKIRYLSDYHCQRALDIRHYFSKKSVVSMRQLSI